jgi:hypothetical protein
MDPADITVDAIINLLERRIRVLSEIVHALRSEQR